MLAEKLNDGLSVAVVGSGPPLVSIPGLGSGGDLTSPESRGQVRSAKMLATATKRTVHLINRPVDMPSGTTIASLAGWYASALRERFTEPVDVVGASAGGVTALQLAIDHPDVVRRLVVLIAASRLGEQGYRDLARSMELERQGRPNGWLASGLLARGPLRLPVLAAMWFSKGKPRAAGEFAMVEAARGWDVTARLGEISAPTLVFGGDRDVLVPAELIRATADGIPDSKLVLLRGRGHLSAILDPRNGPTIATFLTPP